eukprot:c5454_g1_i1.p1 GENE.c5454_g1_i1~~c5454_g1_i1.p1  ORF type:complete len:421 (-),score=102.72 c5454_g1_i1:3-1265(-)
MNLLIIAQVAVQSPRSVVKLHASIYDRLGFATSSLFDGVSSKILEFDMIEIEKLRIYLSVQYRDDVAFTPQNNTNISNPDIIVDYISTPPKRSSSLPHLADQPITPPNRRTSHTPIGTEQPQFSIPTNPTATRTTSVPVMAMRADDGQSTHSRSAPNPGLMDFDGQENSRRAGVDIESARSDSSSQSYAQLMQNTPPFATTPPTPGPWNYFPSPSPSSHLVPPIRSGSPFVSASPKQMTPPSFGRSPSLSNINSNAPSNVFMQPTKPQPRYRTRSSSVETSIAQILRIGSSQSLSLLSSGLGSSQSHLMKMDNPSLDAFLDPAEDEDFGEKDSEMSVSTLVRRCETPPRLVSFASLANPTLQSITKDVERLQSEVMMSSSIWTAAVHSAPTSQIEVPASTPSLAPPRSNLSAVLAMQESK